MHYLTHQVNVHPTKRQVIFLNQDKIIESVCMKLQACLSSATQSRVFKVDRILQSAAQKPAESTGSFKQSVFPGGGGSSGVKVHESKMVRSDYRVKTLDSFLAPSHGIGAGSAHLQMFGDSQGSFGGSRAGTSQSVFSQGSISGSRPSPSQSFNHPSQGLNKFDASQASSGRARDDRDTMDVDETEERKFVKVQLNSVLNLLSILDEETSPEFTELIRSHVFVGLIDDSRALVQVTLTLNFPVYYWSLQHKLQRSESSFLLPTLPPRIRKLWFHQANRTYPDS
jgi:DNA mismatch repair ATPase MutL